MPAQLPADTLDARNFFLGHAQDAIGSRRTSTIVIVVLDAIAFGDGPIDVLLAVVPAAGFQVGFSAPGGVHGEHRQRPLEILRLAGGTGTDVRV